MGVRFFLFWACSVLAASAMPLKVGASVDAAFFTGVGNRALATGAAPGIAMAVVSRGQIVYEGGFGLADVASRTPVTPGTRFAIGSLTKQFTAAAVQLLADRGKLSLDDPLAKYVPSLPNAREITLRMLLDQTSGLQNYPTVDDTPWPMRGPVSTDRVIALLATQRPDFPPGARWEYSNANYAALAAVVQKVAGVPFAAFLRSRIFAPLAMNDSGFGYAAQRKGNIAIAYADGKAGPPGLSLDVTSGAGAAISTAHDLALWDLGLLGGMLLPQTYLDALWRRGVPTGDGSDRYTAGWVMTSVAGHRELWHNGLVLGIGGYCYNAVFPNEGLAIAILTNGQGASGVPESMARSVAAAFGIGAAPTPVPKVTAAPGDDPAIDALVRGYWNELATGTLDRKKLTAAFSAALTPALLSQVTQGIALMGTLRSFTFIGTQPGSGFAIYRYFLEFASGTTHEWDVELTRDGKIAGSRLVQ
jgi:D-alanyl-D-alanine carboxypeptidase